MGAGVTDTILHAEDSRSAQEQIEDRILLLALVWQLSKRGYIGDRIKVQKTVFLAEYEAAEKGTIIFRYPYFRWHYGPFSKELGNDCILLSDDPLGYMQETEQFAITPDGAELAEAFWLDVLRHERNKDVLRLLEGTAAACASRPGSRIQNQVYRLTVRSAPRGRRCDKKQWIRQTVRDTPEGNDFIVLPDRPQCSLFLPQEWRETLTMELSEHNSARASLRRAKDDIACGRVHEGIFPTDAESEDALQT